MLARPLTLISAMLSTFLTPVAGQLDFPAGSEGFESMAVGDDVTVLGWVVVDSSVPPDLFTVSAVEPGLASERALLVDDTDGGDEQNRFYSPAILAPGPRSYRSTFSVNPQTAPPGGTATKPRFTIQHFLGGFSNTWGIELTDQGLDLVVTATGGVEASAPLTTSIALDQWTRLELFVDLVSNEVTGTVDGGASATLPIDLTADPAQLRFCYRGEGPGNVFSVLLDDVSFEFFGAPSTATFVSIKDNTLYEHPSGLLSGGAGDGFFAGRSGQPVNFRRRGLVAFDPTTGVPADAAVIGAELQLRVTQTQPFFRDISIHRALADWGEAGSVPIFMGGGGGTLAEPGDATWLHTFFDTELWSAPGGDFESVFSDIQSVGGLGSYTWSSPDLTADVRAWLDDPSTNFGWLLLGPESIFASAKRFASREHTTASFRPRLTVTFLAPALPEVDFVRADCNADGAIDIADAIFGLNVLFTGVGPAPCVDACDVNDDGGFDIADVVFLLGNLFTMGPDPGPPVTCGADPTGDVLDCLAFPPCP